MRLPAAVTRFPGSPGAYRSPAVGPARAPEDVRRAPTAPGRPDASDFGVTALVACVPRPRVWTMARRTRRAEGRWRIGRYSTRPVLKHGPRSLTCAQVAGTVESRRRNESEGRLVRPRQEPGPRCPVCTASPSRQPPAPRGGTVCEAERERTRWYPKDGELCLSRAKSEETLMEVRSDSDVQIDRQTWV